MANDYFYRQIKPKMYWGANGEEVRMDKDFEASCVLLAQHIPGLNPKKMTVMEHYSTLYEIEKQNERNKRWQKN